jgi:hypothetical protein
MAIESYELESGVDNYLLEDSSGQLLIDQRVEVISSSTVGITEASNNSWLKVIVNNIGLTDVANTAKGFVKNCIIHIRINRIKELSTDSI